MKKVLIITYYWPPSGGIGVLRCLKMAKYLRNFGWEPIIFTAENPHYPTIDESNNKDIPENITVLKQKIWEPYTIYKMVTGQKKDANVNNVFYTQDEKSGFLHKLSVWIRSNFFIPDARAMWIKPSVKFLTDYIKNNQIDAILTDGPPHTNTRIATLLKKNTGTPWLSDYQDPWTQVDYYQLLRLTKWADKKHRRLEQEAFKYADKVTIVSPTWKKELEDIGAKNVSVIYWGFDTDDYGNLPNYKKDKFTISHIGILGYDRKPETFFKVIKKLCEENDEFKNDLEIKLVGQVDFSVKESYEDLNLNEVVNVVGYVPRKEALNTIAQSSVLFLPLNKQDNVMGRIPGKLFEYLAVKKYILCLGPPQSDVGKILEKTKSGYTKNYEDFEGIKQTLLKMYQHWKQSETFEVDNTSNLNEYTSYNLTKKIAGYLDEISNK